MCAQILVTSKTRKFSFYHSFPLQSDVFEFYCVFSLTGLHIFTVQESVIWNICYEFSYNCSSYDFAKEEELKETHLFSPGFVAFWPWNLLRLLRCQNAKVNYFEQKVKNIGNVSLIIVLIMTWTLWARKSAWHCNSGIAIIVKRFTFWESIKQRLLKRFCGELCILFTDHPYSY